MYGQIDMFRTVFFFYAVNSAYHGLGKAHCPGLIKNFIFIPLDIA